MPTSLLDELSVFLPSKILLHLGIQYLHVQNEDAYSGEIQTVILI